MYEQWDEENQARTISSALGTLDSRSTGGRSDQGEEPTERELMWQEKFELMKELREQEREMAEMKIRLLETERGRGGLGRYEPLDRVQAGEQYKRLQLELATAKECLQEATVVYEHANKEAEEAYASLGLCEEAVAEAEDKLRAFEGTQAAQRMGLGASVPRGMGRGRSVSSPPPPRGSLETQRAPAASEAPRTLTGVRGFAPESSPAASGEEQRMAKGPRYKVDPPHMLDRQLTLPEFNSWVVDTETWLLGQDLFNPEHRAALLLAVRTRIGVTGKRWFDAVDPDQKNQMTFEVMVAKLKGLYTSNTATDALYDEYEKCRQRGRRFQEYAAELETFKQLLGNQISDVQLNRHLVRHADKRVQEQSFALINSETMSFREIVEVMQKHDDAQRALGMMHGGTGTRDFGPSSRGSGLPGGGIRTGTPGLAGRGRGVPVGRGTTPAANIPLEKRSFSSLTAEEREELRKRDRELNRCFYCHEGTHTSWDCPRKTARDARFASIQAEMEELEEEGRYLDSIREETEDVADPEEEEEQGKDMGV